VKGLEILARLPYSSASAQIARSHVADALAGLRRADLADDASSLVSELVTNAVLHARTEITLSLEPCRDGLRVAVTDGSPVLPRWSPHLATATSGRGLLLVERLSTRWGAEPLQGGGKVVWAEIDQPASDEVEQTSAGDLLALWGEAEDTAAPAHACVSVNLEVDVAAMLDSQAHTDDLVRDLQLTLLNATSRVTQTASPPEIVHLARRLDAATEEFDDARRQIHTQALIAAEQGKTRTELHLHLHRSAARAAERFLDALEEADRLTRSGALLLPPFPEEMTAFRATYLAALIEQLESA
jgi:anti-sigma regulatory factor (Ser/Thr protein kinase)